MGSNEEGGAPTAPREGEAVQPERERPGKLKRDSDATQHGSESWKEGMKAHLFYSLFFHVSQRQVLF